MVLKCEPDENTYKALVDGSGEIGKLVKENKLKRDDFLQFIKGSTMCTVCPSTILPDAMERSRGEIEQIAVDKEFGVDDDCNIPQRGTQEFEEWAILQCMFKHAQNIAQFWFQNNQNNQQFWDKNFPNDFPFDDRIENDKNENLNPIMYPFRTKINLNEKQNIQLLENKQII